jgi:aminotransferase
MDSGPSNNRSSCRITERVRTLAPSGIRRFFDLVEAMPEAISLGIGEPDFTTPWRVSEAGIFSLERGHTHYTPNRGIGALRNAIAQYLQRRFGMEYDPKEEILVTVGGSEAIDLALRVLIEAGDGVVVPEPCFVSYCACATLARGTPITIATHAEDEFRLLDTQVAQAVREGNGRARALLFGYPNNPTGAVMHREDLLPVAQVAKIHDLIVISDEIYAELNYGAPHASIAGLEGMKERTILVSGFSKAFAMTGWRLGYVCGPADLIDAMTKIHSYTAMCCPTTAQEAAIEAMTKADEDVAHMAEQYNQRRRVVLARLKQMGLKCFEPRGAFYAFPSIQNTGLDSETFCRLLLEQEKVAMVPGNAFGACGEGFVRISYATAMDKIEEALERTASFVSRYIG